MVSAALTIKREPGADPVNLPILLAAAESCQVRGGEKAIGDIYGSGGVAKPQSLWDQLLPGTQLPSNKAGVALETIHNLIKDDISQLIAA
jgi:hypothetical protein